MFPKTPEEILEFVKRENVQFVRLMFTDLAGIPKNVEIPVEELETALSKGIYFDGSSVDGFSDIEESDLLLKPDPTTFAVLPWTEEGYKTARLICDIYKPGENPEPFVGDPRYVLKKVMKQAEQLGFTDFKVGPEMEFFLFAEDPSGKPSINLLDRGGYFDLLPVDKGEKVRQEITVALKHMGFAVEAAHHEVAPSQHEIDFRYDSAVRTADNVITLKVVAKTIALQHGMVANFMPKPIVGVNGSGMHIHMSLSRGEENAFYDPSGPYGGLSEVMLYFIGGILTHIRAIAAITNPTVNSYKRLVPHYEAPTNACWALTNRSALIRIPTARGKGTRLELRNPDPSANPYLAFAVILAAGLDGIKNKIQPPQPVNNLNTYDISPEEMAKWNIKPLPENLKEAIDELLADDVIKAVLGPHILDKFVELKCREWREYNIMVHRWELEKYWRV